MAFLRTYLADREIQSSNAATFVSNLPKTGNVSAINVGVRITNGATSGLEIIADAIDRIEVLANGSIPIVSMTGRMAYAYASLMGRRRPSQSRNESAAAVQEAWFLIPFGYTVWDPSLYLDLGRWQSVQLRVTFSPTISATTFATGTTTFSVLMYQWSTDSQPGGGRGHIRNTEIFSFTSGASGDQPVDLPTEFPLLGLLIFSREAGIAIETDITRVRLLDKIGGQEIYNRRIEDGMAENHEELGLEAIERYRALRGDTETLDTDVNFPQSIAQEAIFTQSDANGLVTATWAAQVGDRWTLSLSEVADAAASTHFTSRTTLTALPLTIVGRGLPHTLYLPMHHWGRPETAYPANQRDQARLLITQGGAGATVVVNALQLAP